MNTILFMVSVALLLSLGFVASYLWATSIGQFDDLDTPARRILKNDIPIKKNEKNIIENNKVTNEGNENAEQSEG